MVPGIDVDTSRSAIQLTEQHHDIFAAVGVHPNEAIHWTADSAQAVRRLANHPRVRAIGEIGLDYYRDTSPKELQIQILREQLRIAAETRKPVIIHNRQASADLYPLLLEWHSGLIGTSNPLALQPGVLHAFNEDHPFLEKLIGANFFFGIGGPITFTNDKIMAQLVAKLPLDKIVLETDAPYLTPHPYRGKRNEPAHIRLIAEKLAAIRSIDLADLDRLTCDNAEKLFVWREGN